MEDTNMQALRLLVTAGLLGCLNGALSAQEQPPQAWSASLGVGAIAFPSYPGSDEYRLLPVPLAQVSYRNRVYLGPSTAGPGGAVGGYLLQSPRVGLAAELAVQDDRPATRADALAGMEDRSLLATAGVSLTIRSGAVETVLGASQGLNDGGGLVATVRVGMSRMTGRFLTTVGVTGAVADARQMRREFGVTASEARRRQVLIDSGDDRLGPADAGAYTPSAGLRHLGASLSLAFMASRRWTILCFGGVDRLGGEPSASPLVRRRAQVSGGLGLGYRL
jgi:outer membrane scaffolding protein for murein synthesis (MipA/OmpV family)